MPRRLREQLAVALQKVPAGIMRARGFLLMITAIGCGENTACQGEVAAFQSEQAAEEGEICRRQAEGLGLFPGLSEAGGFPVSQPAEGE